MSAEASVWSQGGEGEEMLRREQMAERDEAFAALVACRSRLMFRVAYALLRNAQDAEDAVQEAFLKLYRGEAWRRMEDERGFLARTVWRVGLDRLPRRDIEDVARMELASPDQSPEMHTIEAEEQAIVSRLIGCLPGELRLVLLLSAVEEMPSRDIGIALGIAEGTVRTRLMRAKSELKKRYEGMREGRR